MAEVKAKKICIAIHGLAHAGAERVATSWANHLAQQGHAVFVLVYAPAEDTYELDPMVRVVPIAATRDAYFQMSKSKAFSVIRKIIKRECPELIISFLPKMQIAMMLATLGLRIKRVETVRNNPWVDRDVEGKRFLWNLCFHRSDAIIVQTGEQAQYFSKQLQKKITVISNPVSDDFSGRQKVYGDSGIRRFVAVARLNTQKNYPLMIRAFAQAAREHPECILDIYGAGTPEKTVELQGLIDELGMTERIQLQGWRKEIAELLPGYDAFLLSSDYEGMPNALAEAMATGLVCLSTDCKTGPKDMIEPGINGFLATTGDVDSFADGIRGILELSPQQCGQIGAAAREKILSMCNKRSTLERLEKLIESEV